MTGSHIDTVRTGGRYDGNLGVLAGLEVVEVLERAGIVTRRPLAVAFFTNEEGSRFQPDMMGSLTYVGGLAARRGAQRRGDRRAERRRRAHAHRLRRAAALSGFTPRGVRRAAHRTGSRPRGRGRHDRRGRERPGHLLAGADDRRPVQPCGHHTDVDAPRRGVRCRGGRRVRAPGGRRDGRPPSRDGRTARPPSRPRERRARPRHPHGRPPQHRRCAADRAPRRHSRRSATGSRRRRA